MDRILKYDTLYTGIFERVNVLLRCLEVFFYAKIQLKKVDKGETMGKFSICALFAALFYIISSAMAAEFTADMVQIMNGKQLAAGKVTIKDMNVRMDMDIEGQKQVSIMDPATKKVILLMPDMHAYMEMQTPPNQLDTAALSQVAPDQGQWRTVGTETIDGWACEKRELISKDKSGGEVTAWFATKLNYPIKIVHKDKDVSEVLYKNIKQSPVDAALFAVPAGYQMMAMPGMPMMGQ